eukprot:3034692-Prymnesium_polylepis.1
MSVLLKGRPPPSTVRKILSRSASRRAAGYCSATMRRCATLRTAFEPRHTLSHPRALCAHLA